MPEDIADLLVTAGLGTLGTTLVMGRLPEQPDVCAAIADTAGRPAAWVHNGGERRYPHVQVIVRDRDPQAARTRARDIRDLLVAIRGGAIASVNGRTYKAIYAMSEPFAMTGDSSGRSLVGCNYECWMGVD
jgi:hypothetical protein